jgi:hypothetical protein
MRAPSLSTVSTLTPISPSRTQNHLSIGAPLVTFVERHHVAIYASPPPSDAIGGNPDDLLSLSLCEPTMDQEPAVVL